MIKSKKEGWLNIQPTHQANVAQLAKAGCQMSREADSLWEETFHSKYLKGKHMIEYSSNSNDRFVSLEKDLSKFQCSKTGIQMEILKRFSDFFWFDRWAIVVNLTHPLNEEEKDLKLVDVINPHGKLNLTTVQNHVAPD